ncbi:MAG: hypothetical protein JHC33_00895 [Ignisphaera sp.]|jgi:hypothetical protein|nr:hypothetical protein [Ignisphaera sp.]
MATVNISGQFLNAEKREHEAVVVTLPALLSPNGGRANPNPTYLQVADVMTANVLPKEVITGKVYLLVEEAFPAGMTATVTVGGTTTNTAVSVAAAGLTASASVDLLKANGGTVTVTINHATVTGNITTGKLRVIVDTIPYTVRNGRYAVNPV